MERCPLCGGAAARRFRTQDVELRVNEAWYELWLCEGCGSYFQNPLPGKDEIPLFYPVTDAERYGAYVVPELAPLSEGARRLLEEGADAGVWKKGKQAAAAFWGVDNRIVDLLRTGAGAGDGRKSRKVLDVGCGSGYFTMLLRRDLGIAAEQIVGIDIHPGVAELGKRIGLRFMQSRLEDFPEDGFDLVTMSHVLEHEPDPRAYLVAAHRRLKPGGTLYVSLPNAQSLPARIMGKRWICHSVPRHIYNFSREGVLAVADGLFGLEAYSAADIYTFMLSTYYSRTLGKIATYFELPVRLSRTLVWALNAGDNQSFVFRKIERVS